jgi:sulfite reductase (NADPH) flavoprotein alpha-component
MNSEYDRAPAAEIVAAAEADARANGHSARGFLSRACGFLPIAPPARSMPASHRAWDEAAAMLPQLIASERVRATLGALPRLPANPDELADAYVWRASLLLGFLAHAHTHTQEAAAPLPPCITEPWAEVNRRLGRSRSGLAMAEYATYNWALKDERGPRLVENLDLLVYWFGNCAEQFWTASTIEMHGRSGPLIDAAANLQTAAMRRDAARAKLELGRIQDFVHDMTFKSLLKIDPNPHSDTHVDQLLWSKTWALFTAATNPEERGLGASGSPIIQLLDAVFERGRYATEVSHETRRLAGWLPEFQKAFIDSFGRQPVSKFIAEAGDRELAGIYHGALEAYAGKRGFLGAHRLKVYGYMEVGFAAGRTGTNSGFSGDAAKRAWDELDDTLEATRRERFVDKPAHFFAGSRASVAPAAANPRAPVNQVTLDVSGQGLRYVAGDRLGILPQSSPELVDKTLRALQATGAESIVLSSAWREALRAFSLDAPHAIPLRDLLSCAKLRPLARSTGKFLLQLSRSKRLHALLEARQEDQIELWDAFELLAAENYDVRRFWRAAPWEAESITHLLAPERTRIYSISSAPLTRPGEPSPPRVDLTIGRLAFETKATVERAGIAREGTGSGHLVRQPARDAAIPIHVIHPSRFHLPDDPVRPIVMFAGGTGVAPFRGFVQQRAADPRSGPNLLFLGARTLTDVPYEAELRRWVAEGKLDLHAAFSREPRRISCERGELRVVPGAEGYVDNLLQDEATEAKIWRCLQEPSDGGSGGYFYICGQASFAHTVIEGIKALIARRLGGEPGQRAHEAALVFRRMMAHGRFMLDVFTTFAPSAAGTVRGFAGHEASEVILHNNDQRGHWIIIRGLVYDMSEFMYLHPGGERLLVTSAGLDGTQSYEKTEHHLNPEIHALLDLYKIGFIRRLNFEDGWGIAVVPRGQRPPHPENARRDAGALEYLSLHDFYRRWIRFVFKIVGIENALHNNLSLRHAPIVTGSAAGELSKLTARLLLEPHIILHDVMLRDALDAQLARLWSITVGFCRRDRSITALPQALSKVAHSDRARAARSLWESMSTALTELAPRPADDPAGWARLDQDLQSLARCDRALLTAIKMALRDGLLAFEAHEARVVERGGDALVHALEAIAPALERYYDDLHDQLGHRAR